MNWANENFENFKKIFKNTNFYKYVYQIFQIVLEFYKICKNYIPNFDKNLESSKKFHIFNRKLNKCNKSLGKFSKFLKSN